jgi:hypothetical protein
MPAKPAIATRACKSLRSIARPPALVLSVQDTGELLQRFRAKWQPVRVKKTRQKNLKPGSDSIRTGLQAATASAGANGTIVT